MFQQLINPPELYQSKYYTQAVTARGGTTLYVSGQWACDAQGELIGRVDKRTQAIVAFQNLKAFLAAGGVTPADVELLDAGLSECFGPQRHFASTLVGVQALAREGMLIELEAIAVCD